MISMVFCIPAAYSIARFKYPGRNIFMLSFLLTNAFPKLGIYTSIAVLFYKYGLMGTYAGVVIIHMINICSVSAGVYIYTNLKEQDWEK